MAATKKTPQRRTARTKRAGASVGASAAATSRIAVAAPRRNTRPLANPPSVAPCAEIEALQTLAPDQARQHVAAYLRGVMSLDEANAFEVGSYRWEVHLVAIDELRLVRGIELDATKLRRFRRALGRGVGFPPVVGLGGDGESVTCGVLLCDGYHRAVAMRDAGIHYVWAWLATGSWQPEAIGVSARTR